MTEQRLPEEPPARRRSREYIAAHDVLPGMAQTIGPQHQPHHGDQSMEVFIKHQMMTILQPFSNHVQELEAHLTKLAEDVKRTNANIDATQTGLETTNSSVFELRTGLKKTNARLTTVREGLEKAHAHRDLLQAGLEKAHSHAARLTHQLDGTIAAVHELQRGVREADGDIVGLQKEMKQTKEKLHSDLQHGLDNTKRDIMGLHALQSNLHATMEGVKAELERNDHFLQETREALERNNINTATLDTKVSDFTKDFHLWETKLEEFTNLTDKNERSVASLDADVRVLKAGLELNDAVIHDCTHTNNALSQKVTTLAHGYEKWGQSLKSLEQGLGKTNQNLSDTMDGLAKTTNLSNQLYTGLQKNNTELHKATLQLDSLDMQHNALLSNFEKTTGTVTDLLRGHRKGASDVQTLQHELVKMNETMQNIRTHLDNTTVELHGVKSELGRTNDVVQKIDVGMEFCHAGFTGLRKGFMDTGTHIKSNTHTMLPKLTQLSSERKGTKSPPSSALSSQSTVLEPGPKKLPPMEGAPNAGALTAR